MNWRKMGRTVSDDGTTITYWADNAPITIESRKRHIPHANGVPGTWIIQAILCSGRATK